MSEKPKKIIDNETKEIIKDFVSEAFSLIEDAEREINNLSTNKEAINTIFRLFHSLKGASGFLNFENINQLTHLAESLLDLFRKKNIIPTGSEVNLLYEIISLLEKLIHSVSEQFTDEGFETQTSKIMDKINQNIIKLKSGTSKKDIAEFTSESSFLIEKIEKTITNIDKNEFQRDVMLGMFKNFYVLTISAKNNNYKDIEEICIEVGNLINHIVNDNIVMTEEIMNTLSTTLNAIKRQLRNIEKSPDIKPEPPFPDKYEIISNIKKLTGQDTTKPPKPLGEILIEMGLIDEKMIREALNIQKMSSEEKKRIDVEDVQKCIDNTNRFILQLEAELKKIEEENNIDKDSIISIFRKAYVITTVFATFGYSEVTKLSIILGNFLDNMSNNFVYNTKMRELLLGTFNTIKNTMTEIEKDPSIEPNITTQKSELVNKIKQLTTEKFNPIKMIEEILVDADLSEKTIESVLQLLSGTDKKDMTEILKSFESTKQDIRVDTKRLDSLFELVGELTIAGGSVSSLDPTNGNFNATDFRKATLNLTKIITDIQSIVVSIRMVPLESLFSKMKRLVHQLSTKANKKIDLHIEGAGTEIDKNLIEEITNPIVHLIRNAIDHGIEPEKERKEKGKKSTGNIFLKASHEGNEIWISVKDDGTGLDTKKIFEKAKEKGLIDKNITKLPDKDIWEFVFEPGFSTAAVVTDVSGRGVGMDVVKKNIEKIKGSVEIDSVEGKGTEITLKIPLTIEIMDVMTVNIGKIKYSIPMTEILETIPLAETYALTIGENNNAIKLRDDIIPIIKLENLLEEDLNKKVNKKRSLLVVVKKNNKKACLFVDSVERIQQTVIKSVPTYFGNIDFISGCSILANGEISPIMDIGNLINKYLEV